ncbi:MAG: hypothetical protein GVY28_02860, partial [Alphaproteobacteria bacterium]|nr:hypothetical protein [Alphaproteobacteria bacterium]
MKDGKSRRVWIAALMSVLLHAAVAVAVFDVPVGRVSGELFTSQVDRRTYDARVARAAPEAYVDPVAEIEDLAAADQADASAQAKRMWRELVRQTDAAALDVEAEAADPPAPEPEDPDVSQAAAVPPAQPQPGEAAMVDAAAAALQRVNPSILLPEYVAPTDEVERPEPSDEPIDPRNAVDTVTLEDLGKAAGALAGRSGR